MYGQEMQSEDSGKDRKWNARRQMQPWKGEADRGSQQADKHGRKSNNRAKHSSIHAHTACVDKHALTEQKWQQAICRGRRKREHEHST